MKTRVLSGLAMLPLIFLVAAGGPVLILFCFVVTLMALKEFFGGFNAMNVKPSMSVAVISTIVLYTGVAYFAERGGDVTIPAVPLMMWLFISVLMPLIYLFNIEERNAVDGLATITGIAYIVYFCVHLVLIDMIFSKRTFLTLWGGGTDDPTGFYVSGFVGNPIWLVVITALCTDIFAYFSGYFLGKHKLCPTISPKKTVEGAVGGVIGTMACTALFGWLCLSRDHMAAWMVLGLVGSIISMFGDLTASVFKRKMGIKDYGDLIPGHGGVLDRIDSVLFTAPVIFYGLCIIDYFTPLEF